MFYAIIKPNCTQQFWEGVKEDDLNSLLFGGKIWYLWHIYIYMAQQLLFKVYLPEKF